jgi:hypothetical protein
MQLTQEVCFFLTAASYSFHTMRPQLAFLILRQMRIRRWQRLSRQTVLPIWEESFFLMVVWYLFHIMRLLSESSILLRMRLQRLQVCLAVERTGEVFFFLMDVSYCVHTILAALASTLPTPPHQKTSASTRVLINFNGGDASVSKEFASCGCFTPHPSMGALHKARSPCGPALRSPIPPSIEANLYSPTTMNQLNSYNELI